MKQMYVFCIIYHLYSNFMARKKYSCILIKVVHFHEFNIWDKQPYEYYTIFQFL